MNATKKMLLRVPVVTILFWVVKTLSTTVGETAADFMSETLGLGMPLVALIMSSIMAVLLILQFVKLKRYVPVVYWSIVILMSIVGTLITDILVDTMGLSLVIETIIFSVTMILGFILWYGSEHTLSIHSIDTPKREAYYWIVILLAFALGTGLGDMLSEKLALGYGTALLLFAGAIALVAVAYYALKLNETVAFWIAFILTRPLGASTGDFLTAPVNKSGLGISLSVVNIIFFSIIILTVVYMSMKQKKLTN